MKKYKLIILLVLFLCLVTSCKKKIIITIDCGEQFNLIKYEIKQKETIKIDIDYKLADAYIKYYIYEDGKIYKETDKFNKNTTLKAVWSNTVNIKIDYGELGVKEHTISYNSCLENLDSFEHYNIKGYLLEGKEFDIKEKIMEDITLKAIVEPVEYICSFYNNGVLYEEFKGAYNTLINYPNNPTREKEDGISYVFDRWSINPIYLDKNYRINAIYKEVFDTFTITYINENDEIITTETITYGDYAYEPNRPNIEVEEGKKALFKGWIDVMDNKVFDFEKPIYKDYILKAKFKIDNIYIPNLEEVTISILGDSISTFYKSDSLVNSYYKSTNEYYYPTYSATVKDVSATWWYQTITNVGATLGTNNSLSGSAACGTSDKAGCSKARLMTLHEVKIPNIVFVFLGTNDNVNGNKAEDLKQAYIKIIDYISENCIDETEKGLIIPQIYIFNNGYSSYTGYNYTEQRRIEYNNVFCELVNSYENVHLFDLASLVTKDNYSKYLGDFLHYNADGMKLISTNLSALLEKDYNKKLETKKVARKTSTLNNNIYYYKKEGEE